MKLRVFRSVGATYGLAIGHFGQCARIVWLPLALIFVLSWFLLDRTVPLALDLASALPPGASAGTVSAHAQDLVLFAGPLLAGAIACASIMCAGIWRFVLRGTQPRLAFYLGFGADELRLIVAWTAKLLLLLAVGLGASLLCGAGAMAAVRYLGVSVWIGFGAALVVALMIFGWVAARFSLVGPATVAEQRLGIVVSWQATRHNAGGLRRFFKLVALPIILGVIALVGLWSVEIFLPALRSYYPATVTSPSLIAAACLGVSRALQKSLPVVFGIGYIAALLFVPVLIAARAIAYNEIKDDGKSAPAKP